MTVNSVITSLEEVKELLLQARLLKQENTSKSHESIVKHISEEFRAVMFEDDYERIYRTGLQHGDYFCILTDDSYLRFNAQTVSNHIKLSYQYCPNPRSYKTYPEFLKEMGLEEFQNTDIAMEDYDQYVSEAKLNSKILPIRYDYDELSHRVPDHATSHIHFGFFEHVRIPVSKMLTPQAFVILIIKIFYFRTWQLCQDNEKYMNIEVNHKNRCSLRESELFDKKEKIHFFLE